ncbi:hypothetical protein MHBO_001446 [Bonamia ostreae]|uniref:Uncharacterized protein n=1 Tax=Bonamia ostreae TaxID=126728 RepID=A0ABV2AIZ6_9EUKA
MSEEHIFGVRQRRMNRNNSEDATELTPLNWNEFFDTKTFLKIDRRKNNNGDEEEKEAAENFCVYEAGKVEPGKVLY